MRLNIKLWNQTLHCKEEEAAAGDSLKLQLPVLCDDWCDVCVEDARPWRQNWKYLAAMNTEVSFFINYSFIFLEVTDSTEDEGAQHKVLTL